MLAQRTVPSVPAPLPAHLLLSAIVSSSDDAIVSKTLDGQITTWNQSAEKIFGYTAAEIVGQSIFTLIPPELHEEERGILARLRRGERIEHFESRRRRKDGSIVFVALSISPIRDADGVIVGASKVARDISFERSTRLARSWLAAIVDSSDDAIISKDLNGTITTWNAAARRIFGYTADEIIGTSVLRLIPPELHSDEPMIIAKIKAGDRIDHFETIRLAKDGRRLQVSLTVSPIRDEHGVIVGASKVLRDITAEKEGDFALHRLAAIVDSSDDAIIGKDLNGIITSWNTAATRLFGYTADEAIGQPVTILMRPEEAADEPTILARLARGERIDHYETIRRAKNGALISVSLTISAVRDRAGRVIGASKIARDITKQKEAEAERMRLLEQERDARSEAEALREAAIGLSSELNLQATIQRATDIATKLSGAKFGAFFYNAVNDRHESYVLYTLSGAPREAFEKFGLPRNTAIFGPTFRGESVVRLDDVTADPRYGHNAPHHGMPAGHLPVRSYLAVPVRSRGGEVIGGLFFAHPEVGRFSARSERIVLGVAAQAAIAIENAKLYEHIESTAARLNFSLAALRLGDWNWNAATDEIRFSPRGAEIYGIAEGLVGQRELLRDRLHPDDRERARAVLAESLRTGSDYDIEYRLRHPTLGERWISVKARSQKDDAGVVTGMMGVVQDITDRKRIELELRESREKLQTYAESLESHVAERTARLRETIGELEAFSYSVSHDMRTPLRAMQGYADRLLQIYGPQLDAEAQHHLGRISKNAERLELLVRDVLAYSRVAKGEIALVPIDLEKFLEALSPNLPELHRRDVTFTIHRPLPVVRGHEAYLSQVFTNLIANAVKFAAPERPPRIQVRALRRGDEATIEVEDNGIGIEEEHFGRIFEIFGRVYADKKYEGTGIGLSIVRKAVQRMGGQIAVRSKPGIGTCFSFTLTLA